MDESRLRHAEGKERDSREEEAIMRDAMERVSMPDPIPIHMFSEMLM